jgi:stage II sporulation protein AA (anti-sigma F factor antagonist)
MLTNVGYAFSVHRTDGYCIVRATGELDIACVGSLRARVEEARRRAPRIVVDLREVSFMDTFALRALVALRMETDPGTSLHVVPGDHVQRVLDLAGFRDHLRWISAEQLGR